MSNLNFLEVISGISLKEFESATAEGNLSNIVKNLKNVPSIDKEVLPYYEKTAVISAVIERRVPEYASYVASRPPFAIVECMEYALSYPLESDLNSSQLCAEINDRFMEADADVQNTLEQISVALQALEFFVKGNAPAIAEERRTEIVSASAGNIPAAPSVKHSENSTKRERADHNLSDNNNISVSTLSDLRNMVFPGDTKNMHVITGEALEIVFESYEEAKKNGDVVKDKIRRFKKLDLYAAFDCYNAIERYSSWTGAIVPGLDIGNDTSVVAMRYRRYMTEKEMMDRSIEEIKKYIIEKKPEIVEIYRSVNEGIQYQYSFDNHEESVYLTYVSEAAKCRAMGDHYGMVRKFNSIGNTVSEAYMESAWIYNMVYESKKGKYADAGIVYTYGPFEDKDCKYKTIECLAAYFKSAYKAGGAYYSRCVYNLIFRLKKDFTYDYLKELQKYLLGAVNTSEDEEVLCAYLDLMHTYERDRGISLFKHKNLKKMLNKNAKGKDTPYTVKVIGAIAYSVLAVLVSILCPIILNSMKSYTAVNTTVVAVMAFMILAQIVALKLSAGFEKVFRIVNPLCFLVALGAHYLARFGLNAPDAPWWPGSEGSLFGTSFAATLLILLPCCYFASTTYQSIRYWAQSTITCRPFTILIYGTIFFVVRYLVDMIHLALKISEANVVVAFIVHVIVGIFPIIAICVSYTNKKLRYAFNQTRGIIFAVLFILTILAGIAVSEFLAVENVESAAISELVYRMMLIQVPFTAIFAVFTGKTSKDQD